MPNRGKQKLTIKEKKFAAARASGKTNRESYKEAGYSMNSNINTIDAAASAINRRPNVQSAIDAGLKAAGLTPEYAIQQLEKIVSQDDELGAKRLAIKDVLELHGWNKADKPQVHVKLEGSFFGSAREPFRQKPIEDVPEGEVVEDNGPDEA